MLNPNPQDTNYTTYTPKKLAELYWILDTTLPPTQIAYIPAMNGRQGDDLRQVPIAFVDDGEPRDLTNATITLKVLDSSGVVKVSDHIINPVEPKAGLVIFGMPAAMYEASGWVQRAYFTIKDKTAEGEPQQVSTVSVTFDVLQDGIDISQAQSSIYISSIDTVLNHTENLVTTSKEQSFTSPQHFHDVTASTLSAASISSPTLSAVSSSADSATSSLASSITSIGEQASDTSQSVAAVSSSVAVLSSSLGSLVKSQTSAASSGAKSSTASLETAVNKISTTASSVAARVDGLDQEAASTASSVTSLDARVSSIDSDYIAVRDFNNLASSVRANGRAVSEISDISAAASTASASAWSTAMQLDSTNASVASMSIQDSYTSSRASKNATIASGVLDILSQMVAGNTGDDFKASASSVINSLVNL